MPSSEDFDDLAGTVASAVLAVLLVALSTYGRRCRHPALRLVFWGASTAFMPLTSYVLASLMQRRKEAKKQCHDHDCAPLPLGKKMWTLLLWMVLIVIYKGNADTAAASAAAAGGSPSSDDATVDAQKVRTPVELLVKYAWLGYLIALCIPEAKLLDKWRIAFVVLFVLGFAKVVLKLGAFYRGSGSYAVGKNARLVSGYMAQLVEDGEEEGHGGVPPYC